MKPVIIIAIIFSISIISLIPDADAKTWKVYVAEMPKQWEPTFGNLYNEGTSYWEKRMPGTYFTEITQREKADFVVQWSSQFQGSKIGYYTPSSNNDFGRPYIAITLGYMDGPEVKFQDRKFNQVDSEYAKLITIHEIGHAIGLKHSSDPKDIMYPTIYNYDQYLLTNQFEDGSSKSKTSYSTLSKEIQEQVNLEIEKAKKIIYANQEFLESKQYLNPKSQEEINKAKTLLNEAKNYLKQAEDVQTEAEGYLKASNSKEAYYKYVYSYDKINEISDPSVPINSLVKSANKLESQYELIKTETTSVKKQEKTCFLFWCW